MIEMEWKLVKEIKKCITGEFDLNPFIKIITRGTQIEKSKELFTIAGVMGQLKLHNKEVKSEFIPTKQVFEERTSLNAHLRFNLTHEQIHLIENERTNYKIVDMPVGLLVQCLIYPQGGNFEEVGFEKYEVELREELTNRHWLDILKGMKYEKIVYKKYNEK